MQTVNVEIEGISPILFNNFFDPSVLDKPGGKKKSMAQRALDVDQKVYRKTNTGPIGIPSMNIKKCMLEGSQFSGMKIGKRGAVEYIRATMFFDTDFVSFGVKKPNGIHECTGRIPPKTGARVMIRRPYLNAGWKLAFNLLFMDERVSLEMGRDALTEGGLVRGLCDHRPEYGRFKINRFDIEA